MSSTAKRELRYNYLPQFASFLLERIDEYTAEIVRLAYEVDLPLLKTLTHLSEQQRFEFSKKLNIEFLTNLSRNDASGHLDVVTDRWLSNNFENIKRLDVDAQDITLINYLRGRAQKKFINDYTNDPQLVYKLHSEIDDLNFVYNTKSTNDYLKVLQDKIEAETHFNENVIEASPGIIFIYDLQEQREVYINGRVEEVTGFTPEEVITIKNLIAQLAHPVDLPIIGRFVQSIIDDKEGKMHQADYRFKNKAGEYHWMRCYGVVYQRNDKGEPTQILGNSFDVTGEKETADVLLKRERQLLEAQAIGEIGSFELDLLTDKSVHTPELAKIFETVGQGTEKWMERVHPDDVEKVKTAMAESFVSGKYECEFRFLSSAGEKVVVSKGEVSFDEHKKPLKLIGTAQDITRRKSIEDNLQRNTIALEHSNQQLQEFAFIASHDLKEPLRKIGLYSNIIMSTSWDELPEKTKSSIEKINDAAQRMQKLIEGILSYSTLTAQTGKEHYNVQELYEEALLNLEYKINETGAIITSDSLPTAKVIPFQIQQLFQNLIGNALKFSKKVITPEVQVRHKMLSPAEVKDKELQPANKYLQIEVIDNGIGFSKVGADKIFGLFQRLHNRSDYEGSGLGLAICKRIAENHGGVIKATSELNAGSTFTVIIPFE